jgi:2-polyprenyl-6-methoxyphenol hydroxylase-like FAD-dependent oxidoreductase
MTFDVIVIGARVAGAATGMLLARAGLQVLLVDQARFPSDTLSTHQIQVPGVARLARFGLLEPLLDAGTPPTPHVRFQAGAAVIEAEFPTYHGVNMMISPRRTVLDALLVDAAGTAGAEVREGCSLEALTGEGDRVTGVRLHDKRTSSSTVESAALVIGADGNTRRLPAWWTHPSGVGLPQPPSPSTRTGIVCPSKVARSIPRRDTRSALGRQTTGSPSPMSPGRFRTLTRSGEIRLVMSWPPSTRPDSRRTGPRRRSSRPDQGDKRPAERGMRSPWIGMGTCRRCGPGDGSDHRLRYRPCSAIARPNPDFDWTVNLAQLRGSARSRNGCSPQSARTTRRPPTFSASSPAWYPCDRSSAQVSLFDWSA